MHVNISYTISIVYIDIVYEYTYNQSHFLSYIIYYN